MRSTLAMGTAALLAIAATTISGCGGGGASPATIRGAALDDGTLEAIAGATVQVGGASARTAPDGTFSVQTQSGNRTVTFTADGYRQLQENVSLQAGVNQIGPRYLAPELTAGNGAISGTVTRDGSPADGATVRSGDARATSRPDGTFSIYNVGAGGQAVTAISADGRATGFSVVDVEAGQKTSGGSIDLGLTPPQPPVL